MNPEVRDSRTPFAKPTGGRTSGRYRRVLLLSFVLSGLLVGCESQEAGTIPAARTMSKVAVLASSDSTGDLLSIQAGAGLAAEIGHWLTRVPNLVVRLGATEGPGGDAAPEELAARLDVSHIVRVQVSPAEDQWNATWEVVEVHGVSGEAASRTVSLEELPGLPPGIARDVLAALGKADLARDALSGMPLPEDPDAYRALLLLLGQDVGHPVGAEAWRQRLQALEAVVQGLSGYPPAVTELGTTYLDLAGLIGGTGPYYELAGETLEEAFALDPGYPPARDELASYLAKVGRSEEAVALLREGIAHHPSFPGFYEHLGYVLRYAGFMEESMESYRKSQELNRSLDHLVSSQDQITKSLIYLGDYGAALISHRRTEGYLQELGRPANEKQHFYQGVIHLYAGDLDEAVASFERGIAVDPTSVWSIFGQGYRGMAEGNREDVAEVLDRLEERVVVDGERHYRLVHFAAFLDEPERALEHLTVAVEGGFFNAPYIASDPLTAGIRGGAVFQAPLNDAEDRRSRIQATTPQNLDQGPEA